jgi:predicted O-methyltransferase YrrM
MMQTSERTATVRQAKSAADGPIRRVRNRHIFFGVLASLLRNSLRDRHALRKHLLKQVWIELKRFSAPHIRNVPVSEVIGLQNVLITGPSWRPSTLVLAALSRALECQTIFEIGTERGETTWLLARNNPTARVLTLDLPGPAAMATARLELTDPGYFQSWNRGVAFAGTPEARQITQLYGDSAVFDFSPYAGLVDLVFIDGSHSYSYVRSDTEAALGMLSPTGTIVWDDYTHYPGIYAYLNSLSPQLDRPILHILPTRLAVYSRKSILCAKD